MVDVVIVNGTVRRRHRRAAVSRHRDRRGRPAARGAGTDAATVEGAEVVDATRPRRRAGDRRPAHPFRRVEPVRAARDQRHRAGRHDPGRRAVRLLGRRRSPTPRSPRWSTRSRSSASPASTGRGGRSAATSRPSTGSAIATNTVTLVGHNTLRRVGDGRRAARPDGRRAAAHAGPHARGIRRGRPRLLDGPLVRAGHASRRPTSWSQLTRVAAEAGKPYHTHMRYDEPGRPRVGRGGARDRRTVRRRAEHLAPLPAPDGSARRGRPLHRDDRGGPRARRPRDLGHDGLPARRRRVGPEPAALGARRRHGGDAGAPPRSRRPTARSATTSRTRTSTGRTTGTTS